MHVEIMNMKLKNDFTKNVTDDIPVGDGPNGVDVNSNTNMVYVVNADDNNVFLTSTGSAHSPSKFAFRMKY
jgi:DNA-binding beta-propeller fold protein YncE